MVDTADLLVCFLVACPVGRTRGMEAGDSLGHGRARLASKRPGAECRGRTMTQLAQVVMAKTVLGEGGTRTGSPTGGHSAGTGHGGSGWAGSGQGGREIGARGRARVAQADCTWPEFQPGIAWGDWRPAATTHHGGVRPGDFLLSPCAGGGTDNRSELTYDCCAPEQMATARAWSSSRSIPRGGVRERGQADYTISSVCITGWSAAEGERQGGHRAHQTLNNLGELRPQICRAGTNWVRSWRAGGCDGSLNVIRRVWRPILRGNFAAGGPARDCIDQIRVPGAADQLTEGGC